MSERGVDGIEEWGRDSEGNLTHYTLVLCCLEVQLIRRRDAPRKANGTTTTYQFNLNLCKYQSIRNYIYIYDHTNNPLQLAKFYKIICFSIHPPTADEPHLLFINRQVTLGQDNMTRAIISTQLIPPSTMASDSR